MFPKFVTSRVRWLPGVCYVKGAEGMKELPEMYDFRIAVDL